MPPIPTENTRFHRKYLQLGKIIDEFFPIFPVAHQLKRQQCLLVALSYNGRSGCGSSSGLQSKTFPKDQRSKSSTKCSSQARWQTYGHIGIRRLTDCGIHKPMKMATIIATGTISAKQRRYKQRQSVPAHPLARAAQEFERLPSALDRACWTILDGLIEPGHVRSTLETNHTHALRDANAAGRRGQDVGTI
jgi:hypothetical protein